MKCTLFAAVVLGLLSSGCCSNSSSKKATLERGWIGGDFQTLKRSWKPEGLRSRLYLKQVYPGSPTEQAGLKPADVIVAFNGDNVASVRKFRRMIDSAASGSRATIRVWRDGALVDVPVTIGREKFQEWHTLQMGLWLSSHVDALPNPNFSIPPIALYHRTQNRIELMSPEAMLARNARSDGEQGTHSDEGWNAWFIIFGAGAHKRILSQESMPATAQTQTIQHAHVLN